MARVTTWAEGAVREVRAPDHRGRNIPNRHP